MLKALDERYLLLGTSGLCSWGAMSRAPFQGCSAGRFRVATDPTCKDCTGSLVLFWKRDAANTLQPPASLLCADSLLPLAVEWCRLSLLTAAAAKGIEGAVPAKISEPVEAGVRI